MMHGQQDIKNHSACFSLCTAVH